MSVSSNLSPNVVKTALDDVFYQRFQRTAHPGHVDATDGMVFKQDSTDNAANIEEVFKGPGLWGQREEEENVPESDARTGNQITFNVENYAQSLDITKNFFDDNMHGVYERMIAEMADNALITRDKNAFGIYRNAFSGTKTADGSDLVSNSHSTLSGDTVDNKLTDALSTDSLEDALVSLGEQKGQDGVIRGSIPETLLVPMRLFKDAVEITESSREAHTADNQLNVYSAKYGIRVATSPYLGAAAGGSDTAWFVLGSNHSVTRWVRQGIQTELVDWRYQRNNNYIYKGEFREVVGAIDYAGIVGSDGTT